MMMHSRGSLIEAGSSGWNSSSSPGSEVGKANKKPVGQPEGGDAGARATPRMWGYPAARLAVALALSANFTSWMEGNLMQMSSHVVAQVEWSRSSLQASLRVALQVTQRQNRATASNRYSVRDGHRMMIHSRGSLIEAGS
jgi:hypothetical protein